MLFYFILFFLWPFGKAPRSWDFTKREIMGLFKEFFEHGYFVSVITTSVVLIPKEGCVDDIKDFRSIRLVGGLYKWLTKVLDNRLKRIFSKVISKTL